MDSPKFKNGDEVFIKSGSVIGVVVEIVRNKTFPNMIAYKVDKPLVKGKANYFYYREDILEKCTELHRLIYG